MKQVMYSVTVVFLWFFFIAFVIQDAYAGEQGIAYRAAARLSGLPVKGDMPAVKTVSPAFFDELGGNLRTRGKDMWGKTMAVYLNDVVYLSSDLTDPHRRMSWLVHEMVHHLQKQNGMDLSDCETLSRAEANAYAAQNRYLTSNGHVPQVISQGKWCH